MKDKAPCRLRFSHCAACSCTSSFHARCKGNVPSEEDALLPSPLTTRPVSTPWEKRLETAARPSA
eukprot:scaffold384_cov238-Pinguiococcus_pyrenoidosus.AAC.11